MTDEDFRYVEGWVTVAGQTRYAIKWRSTGLVQFMDMANRLRRAVPKTAQTFERGTLAMGNQGGLR